MKYLDEYDIEDNIYRQYDEENLGSIFDSPCSRKDLEIYLSEEIKYEKEGGKFQDGSRYCKLLSKEKNTEFFSELEEEK